MQAIDIARRCGSLNAVSEANSAYILALHQGGLTSEERLEAAVYLLPILSLPNSTMKCSSKNIAWIL